MREVVIARCNIKFVVCEGYIRFTQKRSEWRLCMREKT